MTVQFQCRSRSHLHDQSCRYPVWRSLSTVPYQIDHDNSISFLKYNGVVRSVTLLLYLFFVIHRTLSDQSQQLGIAFYGDHTCMISCVIVVSAFCDRPHSIQLVMKLQS